MIYKSIYLARRNPSVTPEDWPKTWRSHARAVGEMGGAAAPIAATIDTIAYCARIREPLLDGRRCDPPGVSHDHDGVAVVTSRSPALHRIGRDRDGQEAIIADEVRVFGRPADMFSLTCVEVFGQPAPSPQAAVIRFLARGRDVPTDAFAAWLAKVPADRLRSTVADGPACGCAIDRVEGTRPAGYEFDGITELWFATVEDAVCSLANPSPAADDPRYCDAARTVTMLTEVIFRVPR